MPKAPIIRQTRSKDLNQVLALYPLAFPDEELRPVVRRLLEGEAEVLPLAARVDDKLVGHVLFTIFDGTTPDEKGTGALLAPLGVVPSSQRQGLGAALVKQGLDLLKARGIRQVFVLGDPAYYGRLGFMPETRVSPPYPLPTEWNDAWQSLLLSDEGTLSSAQCRLPGPWMDRALWVP